MATASEKSLAVRGVVVLEERTIGNDGFLTIQRMRLANEWSDGSRSAPYPCDVITRAHGQDAVVVVAWHRNGNGVHVLLRDGLRPGLYLQRKPERAVLAETRAPLFVTELVAGIVEEVDLHDGGLMKRAAAELAEEAGFTMPPSAFLLLGAASFPSPGAFTEKFYFVAVEVDPATQDALTGDGSPMEQGATTRWLPLDAAIAACVDGTIVDVKTELGLRRLRDSVSS